MIPFRRLSLTAAAILCMAGLLWLGAWRAPAARAEDPTPPERKAKITVDFTRYFWLLGRYKDNSIACRPTIEHEGVPTYNEVEGLCGKPVAQEWLNTKACSFAETPIEKCPGLYFVPIGSEPAQREVEIILPVPSVWVEVVGCNPRPGDRRCTTLPSLLLRGEEPLPNESIISIQGTLNGAPFACQGGECTLPLTPTGMDGVAMEFWADSSFGDSTAHYTARVRLIPWGDFMNPEAASSDPQQWYVDVLSSQWTGGELASCSASWQVFPGLDGPPQWLSSPDTPEGLQSETGYYYLAGALIQNGLVDASACLDGGLAAGNLASVCGVETARPLLLEWQNRFDGEILQVSKESGVPAQLLKNVFARESQIWPGIFSTYKEAGLGQMTERGADTLLLWNPDFFHQFCPLVLHQVYCDLGFGNLKSPEQAILRGALVQKVNASCTSCAAGIDISQANASVKVFAEGLLANCEQVGRILQNLTGLDAGASSSYEDLWRFTLVNYNGGPGCLSSAIQAARRAGEALDWAHVNRYLSPVCQASIGYVEDITRELKPTPTPTVWLPFGGVGAPAYPRVLGTPTPTPTPAFALSPSPTGLPSNRTATPTPTLLGPTQTPTATSTPSGPTATQGPGYPMPTEGATLPGYP